MKHLIQIIISLITAAFFMAGSAVAKAIAAEMFDKEDHYLSNEKNAVKFYEEMDKFLTKHMGISPYMQK